jgi:ethanolamine transporter EutH
MDTKGKIMNASFMVMGSYVIGGQMAFVAEMTSSFVVFVFILSKIIAGILGTRLSVIMLRNRLLLPQTAGLDDNGR